MTLEIEPDQIIIDPESAFEHGLTSRQLDLLIASITAQDTKHSAKTSQDKNQLDEASDDSAGPSDSQLIEIEVDTADLQVQSSEELMEEIETRRLVDLYKNEVARTALLTAEEEVKLAKRIEKGRWADAEITNGNEKIIIDGVEVYLHKLVDDGLAAWDHLVRANGFLVISIAKRYINLGIPFLDLIQIGNTGLFYATDKFNHRRGYKFSTYATWWIRRAITRAFAEIGHMYRIPYGMNTDIGIMLRKEHELKNNLGRLPSVTELAIALNMTEERVKSMKQASVKAIPLEAPVSDDDDDGSTFGDFVQDDSPSTESAATLNLLRRQLREIADQLDPLEISILSLRFGFYDGRSYSRPEVAAKLHVPLDTVRQKEVNILNELRQPLMKHKLGHYLDGGLDS